MTYIGRVRCREVSFWGQCELGSKNDAHHREVSAVKCPLHRGFVMSA